jgi:hypothetical protein
MQFQKKSIPDPYTNQLDILRTLKMMGYNVDSYKVVSAIPLIESLVRENLNEDEWFEPKTYWHEPTISDGEVDDFQEYINEKFPLPGSFWYITRIDAFPKGNKTGFFTYCISDNSKKTMTFRSSEIASGYRDDLEQDGSASSHEKGSIIVWEDKYAK